MSEILLLNPRRRTRRHPVRSYVERRLGRTIRVRAHSERDPSRHWVRPHTSHSRSGALERVRGHYSNPRRRSPRRHMVRGHYMRDALLGGREVWVRPHMANPRRRRNPRMLSGRMGGDLKSLAVPAVVGAVGGIGLDWAWSKLGTKLPTSLQTGWGAFAAQVGLAVAIGWGADKALPRQRRYVHAAVGGALVLLTYQAIQPLVASKLGIAGLADYTAYNMAGVDGYMPGSVPGLPGGMGRLIMSPASAVQDTAAAIRGNMAPGTGGTAGYIPDSM